LKAALLLAGCFWVKAAFCLAEDTSPLNPLSTQWRGENDTTSFSKSDSIHQISDSLPIQSPPFVVSAPSLREDELLTLFSSPIKLGRDEINLYNPEDLAGLLSLKPSIDVFSLGPFGQKRGFSNWGRIGKGDEILYEGQPRAPIYLNYPQSSEADLTPMQFETADSVYFFDHPLAAFLSGAQSSTSAYLFTSPSNVNRPLVTARLKKGKFGQSTAIFDLQRPLGKKAFARGVGSFKNRSRKEGADNTEVQSYHLSVESPSESNNHWKAGYELDRELGGIIQFTGIPDPNLGKNFRRDAFFVNLDGRLSANTKVEAYLRYQRTDQKISSTNANLLRRVEERHPYFGLALIRQSENWFTKLFVNTNATILNQYAGQTAEEWELRLGSVWGRQLDEKTVFAGLGQLSKAWSVSSKLEGWAGLSRSPDPHQTVFVTVSSQTIYLSTFDRFFTPLVISDVTGDRIYAEVSKPVRPERNYQANLTYKYETDPFTGGFSLIAERANDYLSWQNLPVDISFAPATQTPNGVWEPTSENVRGVGGEVGFELKQIGVWKGGYGLKYLENKDSKERLPLWARHRAYLRWTTPEVRPLQALSIRLVPMVHYFLGLKDDVIPYREKEAFLVNLKAIGAVRGFNFFASYENLFNRQYSLRGSHLQNGRAFFFGFNWELWD